MSVRSSERPPHRRDGGLADPIVRCGAGEVSAAHAHISHPTASAAHHQRRRSRSPRSFPVSVRLLQFVGVVPSSEGDGKKSIPVDFHTRQIVLDAEGGPEALPRDIPGAMIDRPVFALLLRPDGGVAVRQQADDVNDEFRNDLTRNYAHELKESDKKRENSVGSGYGGMMMGGAGGGGGYPGMGGR